MAGLEAIVGKWETSRTFAISELNSSSTASAQVGNITADFNHVYAR